MSEQKPKKTLEWKKYLYDENSLTDAIKFKKFD